MTNKFKQGHKWAMREHRHEATTSKLLFMGVLFICGAVPEYLMWHHPYLVGMALIMFVLAFFVHLAARVSHKVEKHYMDGSRRGRR